MSRYNLGTGNRRDPLELKDAFIGSIRLLKTLCDEYDDGNYYASNLMSVEIDKILNNLSTVLQLRKKRLFYCYTNKENPRNLSKSFNFVGTQVNANSNRGHMFEVKFFPYLDQLVSSPKKIPYSNWIERVVVRKGAGEGMYIPVRFEDQTPFEKREKLTLKQLLKHIRNKSGAHFDLNLNEEIVIAGYKDNLSFGIIMDHNGKRINSDIDREQFLYLNTPIDATIRHAAFELLLSFSDIESELMK